MAEILKRREIPMAICIGTMLFILFEYYTGIGTSFADNLKSWALDISRWAMFVGVVMLFRSHVTRIMRRGEKWPYSIILLGAFIAWLIIQYQDPQVYQFILMNVYTPLGYASPHALSPIANIYRGARVRSIYSAILVAVFLISCFYNSPIGVFLFGPGIKSLGGWIQSVINAGVTRAITIGMGVGMLTMVVRILLGYETSYLGEVS